MTRSSQRGPARLALRAAVVSVLAGTAVITPIRMAEGAPRTRFARLTAAVEARPAPNGYTAASIGPVVPSAVGEPVESEFPVSHLGIGWTGDHDAIVDVRWAAAGEPFGTWFRARHDHDLEDGEDDDTILTQLLRVDGARRFQVRAAGDADDIELLAIDTVSGPRRHVLAVGKPAAAADPPPGDDEGAGEDPPRSADAVNPSSTTTSTTAPSSGGTGSTTTTSTPGQATDKVDQPPVVTRKEWGADESLRKGEPKFAPIVKLFVHHTVTGPGPEDTDPEATVRAIYAYHTQGNGWDDIGYNFLVDGTGTIYEGRYARSYDDGETPTGEDIGGNGVVGAHASGYNFGSAAVAVLGDYTSIEPTSASIKAVEKMMAWKADRHEIDVEGSDRFTATDGTTKSFPNLAGHRDAGQTACPGNALYPLLPEIRKGVARVVSVAHTPGTKGYWTATADGRVLPFGDAQSVGSMAGQPLNAPIVGMAATPSGGGYWLMGGDGGIFTFGDAKFYGSTGNIKLNKPVVRMEPTPTGKGYWLVASDGGIFAFGDAGFFGSTGNIKLNQPIVGMATTKTGQGYWLVASDGGIFAFGDAVFKGSTGDIKLNSPVTSMAADVDGAGYWMIAKDGGVFTFDAPFYGSIPGLKTPNYPGSMQLRTTATGKGYYIADVSGGIYIFGDAKFFGSDPSQQAPKAAVDMALVPE